MQQGRSQSSQFNTSQIDQILCGLDNMETVYMILDKYKANNEILECENYYSKINVERSKDLIKLLNNYNNKPPIQLDSSILINLADYIIEKFRTPQDLRRFCDDNHLEYSPYNLDESEVFYECLQIFYDRENTIFLEMMLFEYKLELDNSILFELIPDRRDKKCTDIIYKYIVQNRDKFDNNIINIDDLDITEMSQFFPTMDLITAINEDIRFGFDGEQNILAHLIFHHYPQYFTKEQAMLLKDLNRCNNEFIQRNFIEIYKIRRNSIMERVTGSKQKICLHYSDLGHIYKYDLIQLQKNDLIQITSHDKLEYVSLYDADVLFSERDLQCLVCLEQKQMVKKICRVKGCVYVVCDECGINCRDKCVICKDSSYMAALFMYCY